MPNLNRVYSQRIAQSFKRLDPWNVDWGAAWYREAHTEAVKLGEEHGIGTDKAAAILAVLSPGAKWEHNIEDARAVCIDGWAAVVTTYPANKEKALNILKSSNHTQFVRGKKVRAFYENINYPGSSAAVTLDRHMLRFLLRTEDNKELCKVFASPKRYERLAEEIRRKAYREGLKPNQLQAMLWLQLRQDN